MNQVASLQGDSQAVDLSVEHIAARLERLPMSSYQRKIFAIIASAWLVDPIDVALLTFLLGSIVAAFHLTPGQAGQLAAMTFAGQLVGNILAGTASDRFGRRTVFQVTMIVWGSASFAAPASWSLVTLMICRFLIGVGVAPGFFTAAFLLEKIGRKPTTARFLVLAAIAAYLYGHATDHTVLFVTGFTMQFFMFGMWSCLYLYARALPDTSALHRSRVRLGVWPYRSDPLGLCWCLCWLRKEVPEPRFRSESVAFSSLPPWS